MGRWNIHRNLLSSSPLSTNRGSVEREGKDFLRIENNYFNYHSKQSSVETFPKVIMTHTYARLKLMAFIRKEGKRDFETMSYSFVFKNKNSLELSRNTTLFSDVIGRPFSESKTRIGESYQMCWVECTGGEHSVPLLPGTSLHTCTNPHPLSSRDQFPALPNSGSSQFEDPPWKEKEKSGLLEQFLVFVNPSILFLHFSH